LENEIKVRHYSPKTLKSYRTWVRKLQTYTQSKAPSTLDSNDVKKFLTYLAVEQDVSASSQNLAFNALLFFYRHVLGREFGKADGIVRANTVRHTICLTGEANKSSAKIDGLVKSPNLAFSAGITY